MKLWIARDRDFSLWLYTEKPTKDGTKFIGIYDQIYHLDHELFPDITFENSPQEVEIKLVKEE